MDNPAVSNVFGTLGAVFWSIQLLPQIILNYRRQSAEGLSSTFMLLWACAGVPLGVYNIVSNMNIALQVQPQVLTGLSLVTWSQCFRYEKSWSWPKTLIAVALASCTFGGIEVGLVYAVRLGIQRGTDWPVELMAVLAAIFLALGVAEQYIAIWKERSVEGISFLFCALDAMGDLTSIISVAFSPSVNVTGLVIYSVELIMWIGIFCCGFYFAGLPHMKETILRMKRAMAHARSSTPIQEDVVLRDVPSSTSVFRIAGDSADVRLRRPIAET